MKKRLLLYSFVFCFSFFLSSSVEAQCSICTKTAQQMGEKPARGLNSGILYLAFMPLALIGVVGYRWWRSNKG